MKASRIARSLSLVSALAVWLLPITPAGAYDRPGDIEPISRPGGTADSWAPSISADGRFVAFLSARDDLVPGDTNEAWDVFVSDRERGTIERVSVTSSGEDANNGSSFPVISPDGRYVAFASAASNLTSGDTNGFLDTFIHDRATGETEITSRAPGGPPTDDISFPSAISAGGRYALIESFADGLVPADTNGFVDVFLVDREEDSIEWISEPTADMPRKGDTLSASMSTDARYVAYGSIVLAEALQEASDLDMNTTTEVLLLDRASGQRRIVSRAPDGSPGNGFSQWPDVSDDGRFVSFWSWANNLVPMDTNGVADIFVADTATSRLERVSVSSSGLQANAQTQSAVLSADGRYVVFSGGASNLVAGDTNERDDVFIHDRELATTERISTTAGGAQLPDASSQGGVSADGRFVTFTSIGTALGGSSSIQDVYLRDRGPAIGIGHATAERHAGAVRVRGWASFSGGTFVSAADATGDVDPSFARAGGDLVGASLSYGPEPRAVTVRIELADMPTTRAPHGDVTSISCNSFACLPSAGTAPGVVHVLSFDLNGVRHELRASLGSLSQTRNFAKYMLFVCDPTCASTNAYDGTYGVTRTGIQLTMPLVGFSNANAPRFTNMRAVSGVGYADSGPVHPIDEMEVPESSYSSTPTLRVALGAANDPPPDTAFANAPLTDGRFDITIPEPPGAATAWARACLGTTCTVSRISL